MLMRTTQQHATDFETFYKDVRSRLLLQTWALTGDLTAGRKAVQDALAIAWHHWRKVSRLSPEEREDWTRPIAWRHALRRHAVPHFHRPQDGDEEAQATLEALRQLPMEERKVLLLAHLTTVGEDVLAREVGITQLRAEQVLRNAIRDFTLARGALPTEVLPCFASMAVTVEAVRWPRPTILTRAGSARRRTHTAIALGLAVTAFAASGFAVTDHDGDRPSLAALSLRHSHHGEAGPEAGYQLAADTLITPDRVGIELGGTWSATLTSDDHASAVQLPCQRTPLADPHAASVVGRTFAGASPSVTAAQTTLASASTAAAKEAYTKAMGWYGGCRDARVQLLATERVTGVGDEAGVVLLRRWSKPQRTIAVGVARTGTLTTAVASTVPVSKSGAKTGTSTDPALTGTTALLGQAVTQLCTLPGAGACTTTPAATAVAPPASGSAPALINAADMPPVAGVEEPWVGTAPTRATTNVAATRCDQADFTAPGISDPLTRSFVIPTAKGLAPQFGLTETIGSFGKPGAAADFVDQIRGKLGACSKKDLGTHVTALATHSPGDTDLSAWKVRVETSTHSSTATVTYLMAIVRSGSAVAQLGFAPSGAVTMSDADFTALAQRAAARLTYAG
jgi:DNA-directed RNA polymerase specialized sigma24 family protein